MLMAAFPHPLVPESTRGLYVQQVGKCKDVALMAEVVQAVIENEERFPPLALLLTEYRRRAKRHADEMARWRGLEEPPPVQAENVRRARELFERLASAIETRPYELNGELRTAAVVNRRRECRCQYVEAAAAHDLPPLRQEAQELRVVRGRGVMTACGRTAEAWRVAGRERGR